MMFNKRLMDEQAKVEIQLRTGILDGQSFHKKGIEGEQLQESAYKPTQSASMT